MSNYSSKLNTKEASSRAILDTLDVIDVALSSYERVGYRIKFNSPLEYHRMIDLVERFKKDRFLAPDVTSFVQSVNELTQADEETFYRDLYKVQVKSYRLRARAYKILGIL